LSLEEIDKHKNEDNLYAKLTGINIREEQKSYLSLSEKEEDSGSDDDVKEDSEEDDEQEKKSDPTVSLKGMTKEQKKEHK